MSLIHPVIFRPFVFEYFGNSLPIFQKVRNLMMSFFNYLTWEKTVRVVEAMHLNKSLKPEQKQISKQDQTLKEKIVL
jgi:hypothetical protein